MKKAVLRIYDFLSKRKALAFALLLAVLAVCAFSALRLGYDEDINAFLPSDPLTERCSAVYGRLGATDRIAVFFTPDEDKGISDVQDAMDDFAARLSAPENSGLVREVISCTDGEAVSQLMDFVFANWPYFLRESDLDTADSLLADPSFVKERLSLLRQKLYSPLSGAMRTYWSSDPLGLFSPVLARLEKFNPEGGAQFRDGYIFAPDSKTGIVFVRSPFGGSESGANASLVSLVNSCKEEVSASYPGISLTSTGAPEVAVENASRIRRDSALALGIALLLICLVLFFSYRRFADVLWIVLSVLAGAVFALGLISLFRTEISVIILGIGSMIIGIAVNYPLHYVDHLKYRPDKREALKDQIHPLVVGNITTVGAFLSLTLLKAGALRDFGFTGAAMLAGTILFVLVFLPVFVPAAKKERNTVQLDPARHITVPPAARKWIFAAFVLLTLFFSFHSGKVVFDSDVRHINYMTAEQEAGFEILSSMGESAPVLYAVAEAPDLGTALERGEALSSLLPADAALPGDFMPSKAAQTLRIERWNAFLAAHPELSDKLLSEARAAGFSDNAFKPFLRLLQTDFKPKDADFFAPVASTALAFSVFDDEGGASVVIRVNTEEPQLLKERIVPQLPEGTFCFRPSDLSNRLVSLLSGDFDKVGLICSLIVLVFLALSFGSLELALVSFIPLAVGWIWILGIMHLGGLEFNIVNIILASFIFGQGDDYTVFITEGLVYERATGKRILHSFRNSVVLSALLMFIGIGALVFARHPAMRSLALVTMLGMVTVVAMACYLPPLLFRLLTRRCGGERAVPVTIGRILATAGMMAAYLASLLVIIPVSLVFFVIPLSGRVKLAYHRFIRFFARVAMNAIPGVHFSVRNPYGEDFSRPALIVCNHQSHVDVLAVLALNPKIIVLTNDWVRRNPLYYPVIRSAQFFAVSDGIENNLEMLRPLVAEGYSVLVFPEGTRSADCSIQRFHRGFSYLARGLGLDLLPLCIHGFGYALPKKATLLRRAGVSLEFGRRISPSAFPESDKELSSKLRQHYIEWYDRIRDELETPEYLADFVKYRYLYRGNGASAECRRTLRRKLKAAEDGMEGVSSVRVTGSGYGSFALLLALSHRKVEVFAYEKDEEKYLCATRLPDLPGNLTFVLMQEDTVIAEADKEIRL